MLTKLISIVVSLLLPIQVASAACSDILADGLWEVRTASGSDAQEQSFLNWMCTSDSGTRSKVHNWSVGVGIPIKGIPVKFDAADSNSSDEVWRNEACKLQSGRYAHASDFSEYVREASKVVVNAWLECQKEPGLQSLTQVASNPKNFYVTTSYRGTEVGASLAGVTVTLVPNNAGTCEAMPPQLAGEVTIVCSRNNAREDIDVLVRGQNLVRQPPVQRVRGVVQYIKPPKLEYVCSQETSQPTDQGYPQGRGKVVVDNTGCTNYCRVVGIPTNYSLACWNYGWVRGNETQPAKDTVTALPDPGYPNARGWIDINGDKLADFCRLVGGAGAYAIACAPSTGYGFTTDVVSPIVDAGYNEGRSFVTKVDGVYYCRRVGDPGAPQLACLKGGPSGFPAQ